MRATRGERLCARLFTPSRPGLEAGMAATVTLCAYPPWAHPMAEQEARQPGAALPTARLIPAWATAMRGGDLDRDLLARRTAGGLLTGSGRYPPEVDAGRFGTRYTQGNPGTLRAAAIVTGWLTLTAQDRYLGPLSAGDRNACVRHMASRAGLLGVTRFPATYDDLAGYYEIILRCYLQGTGFGRGLLASVLRAGDIGGYPGVLLAARSLWLLDRRATDDLGVRLPAEPDPAEPNPAVI